MAWISNWCARHAVLLLAFMGACHLGLMDYAHSRYEQGAGTGSDRSTTSSRSTRTSSAGRRSPTRSTSTTTRSSSSGRRSSSRSTPTRTSSVKTSKSSSGTKSISSSSSKRTSSSRSSKSYDDDDDDRSRSSSSTKSSGDSKSRAANNSRAAAKRDSDRSSKKYDDDDDDRSRSSRNSKTSSRSSASKSTSSDRDRARSARGGRDRLANEGEDARRRFQDSRPSGDDSRDRKTLREVAIERGVPLPTNDMYDPRLGEDPLSSSQARIHSLANEILGVEGEDLIEASRLPASVRLNQVLQYWDELSDEERDALNDVFAQHEDASVSVLIREADNLAADGKVQIHVGDDGGLLDGRDLRSSQSLALMQSVTIVGSSQDIFRINNRMGFEVPYNERIAEENNGNGNVVGGRALSLFSENSPLVVNLVSTNYVRNGEVADPGEVLSHELSHTGEAVVAQVAERFSDNLDLSTDERQTLEDGRAMFYAGQQTVTETLDSFPDQDLSDEGRATLEYMSRTTEIIAFVENNGLQKSAEILAGDTGVSVEEAREYLQAAYDSDAVREVRETVDQAADVIIEKVQQGEF